MESPRNKYLATYAFVSESLESGGSVADGMCEIFRPILSQMSGRVFESSTFAKKVEETYDIKTSKFAAEGIAERLEELGLLTRDSENQLRVNQINSNVPQNIVDSVDNILDEFIDYSKDLLRDNPGGYQFSDDELIDSLTDFLLSSSPEDSLEVAEQNYFKGKTISIKAPKSAPSRREHELDSLVSMYLTDLKDNHPDKIDFLSAVSSASLLSDVVLTLQEPVNKEDMNGIDIYLDTPIVFALLDLSTPEDQEYAIDFLTLLKSCGVNLKFPEHLLVEFRAGLDTQIQAANSGSQMAYGPLVPRIRGDASVRLRARNIYSSPEKYLSEHDITIVSEPDFLNVRFEQYIEDVDKTTKELVGVMGSWETNVRRRENDARSIALSYYARSSKGAETLLESGHVFVTRNESVSKVGRTTLVNRKQIEKREFPPVITDKELAGILWFAGSEVIGRLQKKKLLANCAAIMDPNQAVITTMKEALHNIDPNLAVEMEATILDRNARLKLFRVTRGNESNLKTQDIVEIYELLKESLIQEHKDESAQTITELHENHRKKVNNLKANQEKDRNDFEDTIKAVVDSNNTELEEERKKSDQYKAETELTIQSDEYELDQEKNLRKKSEEQLTQVNERLSTKAENLKFRLRWEIVLLSLIIFSIGSTYLLSIIEVTNSSAVNVVVFVLEFFLILWLSSKNFFNSFLNHQSEKYVESERRKIGLS